MAKWCPLKIVVKAVGWPGFGYHPPEITVKGARVSDTKDLEHQVDEVVRQVELLEWELRRIRLDRR